MDEEIISKLQRSGEDEVCKILQEFNAKNGNSFSFPELSKEIKQSLVECVLGLLDRKASGRLHALSLETLRLLSREKDGANNMVGEACLQTIVRHAGLEGYADTDGENITVQEGDNTVIVEAQKCLCNLIFNNQAAQRICSGNGCVEGIIQRIKTYKDPDLPHEVKTLDMRLLFLITALVRDIRAKLRQDLHGFTYLIEVLDLTLREEEEKHNPLLDQDVDLCCEVLKILFNITDSMDRNNLDEEEEAHFLRLVSILHDLLVSNTASKDKTEGLHHHTVNLLTNMPRESYEELLTPQTEGAVGGAEGGRDLEYDGRNMEAIMVLIKFLEKRLEVPRHSMKDSLTPILLCMCEVCRANRSIRKFCRIKILPYMTSEVTELPEDGQTIRNKLCKLLTSPTTEVKELTADFLFILCKESVTRFVKYTGYGNAAGLLAQRGLMCGGRGAVYSSESEDSETEEYCSLKESVNPVTGRWESTKPDPMAGMSDEQKEVEAMKLINDLDRLHRAGIIQPSRVGEDGKPHPVEHMAQLAEPPVPLTDTRSQDGSDTD